MREGRMATLGEEEFAALQILLKASSKDVIRQLCQECFSSSVTGSDKLIENTCSGLSVTPNEASQLIRSLHILTRHTVYHGLTSPGEILALFPEGFHQNLKNLLTKIILENVSAWRNEAQASQTETLSKRFQHVLLSSGRKISLSHQNILQHHKMKDQAAICHLRSMMHVSLPRLVDLDWRVDIKTSSDSISRMAVPTCLLQLKIQEDAALCGNDFTTSALTVELNKQTLDTMLDGLGRIRDQLSAVANK